MSLFSSLARLRALFNGDMPRHPAGMRQHKVLCAGPTGAPTGLHRMAYTEWGDPRNPRVLVCVHGLTRNCRDFDFLAERLAAHYRVVCPDVVGRGQSDWLDNKDQYQIPLYAQDMITLLARLGADEVDWIGTSMGGLIGMAIAAQPGTPIRRLVLNDVGPLITGESLRRIADYVGQAPVFPDQAAAEQYIRAVSAPFGPLTDAQWRHMTEHSTRSHPDGGVVLRYDPGIGNAFKAAFVLGDVDLWPLYDAIRCPTLCIRGADSDLLTEGTHRKMGERGPRAQLAEVAGVGHAPMFMDEAQVALARDFLLEDGEPPGRSAPTPRGGRLPWDGPAAG